MSGNGLNERILKEIRECSKDDEKIIQFLIDMLYEEAVHAGQWWWKEIYKKKIEEYSKGWGEDNEN